jgi:hypothetical protein
MREKGVSSVLVTSGYSSYSDTIGTSATELASMRSPIEGIVTGRDILYRVVVDKKDPLKVTLGEIMSSPIIAVDEQLLVKDAISLMRGQQIRRLLVTTSKKQEEEDNNPKGQEKLHKKEFNVVVPVGLITLMSIAGNIPRESLDLAEVEIPLGTSEPHSDSVADSGSSTYQI